MHRLMAVLVPVLVVLSVGLVLAVRSSGPSGYAIEVDVNSAQQLARLIAKAGSDVPLAPDGGIDVSSSR